MHTPGLRINKTSLLLLLLSLSLLLLFVCLLLFMGVKHQLTYLLLFRWLNVYRSCHVLVFFTDQPVLKNSAMLFLRKCE